MTQFIPQIRLFLSSPGDVYEERAIVHEEIEALVNMPVFREKVAFRVVAWDKKGAGTVMRFRMPPQEAINKGLPRPSECDIVVVIFWSRLGTEFTANDGKIYQSGTHYELMDAIESPRPEVVIYKGKQTPYFDADAPDYNDKNDQYEKLKTFLKTEVFYDPQTGSPRGVEQYQDPEDFRQKIRTALQELTMDFLAKIENTSQATPAPALPHNPQITPIEPSQWQGSPFPGLRSFQYADAPIFFGRGREANALIERLKHNRFVGVVGASGSGKSSLVMAGVLPRLLERNAIYSNQTASEYWRIVQFTPSSHQKAIYTSPFEALYYALLSVFPHLVDNPLRAQRIKREFLEDVSNDPTTLVETCKFLLNDAPQGSEIVLFVDQFEELFTVIPASDRAPFAHLLKVATDSDHLRVIITMRSDFYHHCADLPILAELLQKGSFPLSTPTSGALYEMIRYPADRASLQFEEGLEQQLLKDTGESAGALALLAYALDELYNIAETRTDRRLTFADYAQLGGVHGAIGKRAEAVFVALDGTEEAKENTLQHLFHALVSVNEDGIPTRQRMRYQRENTPTDTHHMIEAFTQARLLTVEGERGQAEITLEVAHEALFRSWERLKKWISLAQEDLILLRQVRNATQEWHSKNRPNYLLWVQERLVLVYAMQARLQPELNDIESAFIEPEQERLYRELEIITTNHERRRDIGDRLAVIGDTRAGVGVINGVPDIVWLPIGKGGEITIEYGNSVFDDDDDDEEKKTQTFEVKPFYIAKYLTTHAQYQAFVDAEDGYHNKLWWRDFPEEYQPQGLSGARSKMANAPRDTISWYQSVAFGRWLTDRLHGFTLSHLLGEELCVGKNAEIRLPTEWEWQWVAQNGTEGRDYPWGGWQEGYANTNEAGLSRSTAVGMYPAGTSVCGALDMAGNLWAWCLNDYKNPHITAGYRNEESKVRRGGSFNFNRNLARSVSRSLINPNFDNHNFGCCLVFAPITSLDSVTLTSETL
jgi:formylglycine-generating enzyme required for sulfatase activity/energy-coupling factor transporter ATP-binding protein EcfA2